MKTIPLTQGKVALVDDEDYDELSKFKWAADVRSAAGIVYATRIGSRRCGRPKIYMHREILGCEKGQFIDHRDGDGLNNCRSNLRICTREQNMRNTRLRKDNPSGLKGVKFRHDRGKFCARIVIAGKCTHLGHFTTAEAAYAAYCAAAALHYGEFARFN